MGFLAEIAEHEKDESTEKSQTNFFVPFALGKLFDTKSFAELFVQMKILSDRDFVRLISIAVELDARFYDLSQTNRDEAIRQILAGVDCVEAVEGDDSAPLSARAIKRIEEFQEQCDALFADHSASVPPVPEETLH